MNPFRKIPFIQTEISLLSSSVKMADTEIIISLDMWKICKPQKKFLLCFFEPVQTSFTPGEKREFSHFKALEF